MMSSIGEFSIVETMASGAPAASAAPIARALTSARSRRRVGSAEASSRQRWAREFRASSTVPAWTTATLAYTYDGTVAWENLGPSQLFPTNASEAYGVALDPIGDVFVAGGTNTPDIASTVWPFLGIRLQGTGAWVFKASGVNGSFIYGSALQTTETDLTSTIDTARAIAVDSGGSAYIVGTASGTLFTTANGFQQTIHGTQNAFLVKVNNPGSAFEYATYLGGTGLDQGLGVAVNASFSPYVTGATKSNDFPIINPITNPNSDLPLNTLAGPQDAFITRFTSDGSALILSAYLGGSNIDQGNAISVNSLGNIFVAGTTDSTDLEKVLNLQPTVADPTPPYAPPQAAYGGGSSDAFLVMLSGASLPTVTVTPGSLSFPDQVSGYPKCPAGHPVHQHQHNFHGQYFQHHIHRQRRFHPGY